MHFLNLSALEFLGLSGAVFSLVTALYLWDRRRRARMVSTLQFWAAVGSTARQHTSRRIRQPWSLLLQLLSLLLLLLALADLRWGRRPAAVRAHVLLVDVSSWGGPVLEDEREIARRWLQRLPVGDQVMLAAADAVATPLTLFTSDRAEAERKLEALRAGTTALDLPQAFAFARRALGGRPDGEIVYLGPRHANVPTDFSVPSNVRVLSVQSGGENCGIRQAAVRAVQNQRWNAIVAVANSGRHVQRIHIQAGFGRSTFAPHLLTLRPVEQQTVEFDFTTRVDGRFHAQIAEADAVPSDNRVELPLPAIAPLRLLAVTDRRPELASLLEGNGRWTVEWRAPQSFSGASATTDTASLYLLDDYQGGANGQVPTAEPALLFPHRSVKKGTEGQAIVWTGARLGSNRFQFGELRIRPLVPLAVATGETVLATVAGAPAIVARRGSVRLDFDPLDPTSRAQATSALLLASLMQWLRPEMFLPPRVIAERTGFVESVVPGQWTKGELRTLDGNGKDLAFNLQPSGGTTHLQFFTRSPGEFKILPLAGEEQIVHVALGDVPSGTWQPPSTVPTGLPAASRNTLSAQPWPWLAALGGVGLLWEWLLFGRIRRVAIRRSRSSGHKRDLPPGAKPQSSAEAARTREGVVA